MRYVLTIITLLFVCGSSTLFAAGYELQEQSAPAMARVLAVNAKFSDPSMVFLNPAGIAYLQGLHLAIGTDIVTPSFNYKDPAGHFSDQSIELKPVTPVHFYATYGITKDLTIGAGVVYVPWGLALQWSDGFAGEHLTSGADLKIPLLLLDVGYKFFNGKLSIGAFFNASPSQLYLSQKMMVADSDGNLKKMKVELGGKGWGFSGGVGIMVRPIKKLYFGASYRSRIKVNFEGKADFQLPDGVNDQSVFHDQDVKVTFKAPDVISAGVGYDILSDLYMEFDVQYTLWSINDKLNANFYDNGKLNKTLSFSKEQDWSNGFVFRLGTEYTGLNNWIFRGGLGFDQTPVPDKSLSPMLPDSDRIFGSVGAQYFLKKTGLNFALAFQYTYFLSRTVKAADNLDNFGQTYTNRAYLLGLTIGYSLQ